MDRRLMIFLFVVSGALMAGVVYMCYCRGKAEGFSDKGPDVTMTFWKMDSCPYCVEFQTKFDELKTKWDGDGDGAIDVKFVVNNDTDAAKAKQIYSFPTIQFTLADGSTVNFEGERSVENISKKIRELAASA